MVMPKRPSFERMRVGEMVVKFERQLVDLDEILDFDLDLEVAFEDLGRSKVEVSTAESTDIVFDCGSALSLDSALFDPKSS